MGAQFSRSATADTESQLSRSRSSGDGLTAFALRLAKHLAANGGGRNLVFSPLSIYSVLALLAAGARGSTLQELLDALGSASRDELAAFVRGLAERALADRSASGGPAVAFASGVWHDAAWELLPGFCEIAAESYKAEARAVDFRDKKLQAVAEINRWVAASTNNLIDTIVDPSSVHESTRLVLANAIYFKGKWAEPFEKEHTKVGKFYRRDGTAVAAPFMRSWSDQLIAVHRGFKVLKLPYQSPPPSQDGVNARYSMCVFLPDARNGLPALAKKVASSGPAFWRDHLPHDAVDVGDFRLPKFRMEFSDSIGKVLMQDLGIKAAFDEGRADLSDMARCRDDNPGWKQLAVQDVLHKAVIEVNEEGTEAAAVTVCVLMQVGCARLTPPRVDFVADHPFMFFVIEEVSGAIVFMGHVLDPSTSG